MGNIIKDFKGMTKGEILKWAKNNNLTVFNCGHTITIDGYPYHYTSLYFENDICICGQL